MTETLGVGKPTGKPQITQHFPDGSILHPIDGLHWLQCDVCDAAWLGELDEPCGWCWEAEQRQIVWQADRLLEPPDIDPDDATRDDVHAEWGRRLWRGVKADLITETQARTAWGKTQ